MDTGAGSGTCLVWHGVTKAKKDRVGHVITHYNSLNNCYDQSGYPESKADITLLRKRTENSLFSMCQDNLVLLIPFVAILSAQWAVLYPKHIPSNINNQYLGFNAVFCTCQLCMSQSYNPQLQGPLTKALLKKACQSRALIWLAVVFVELSWFRWSSWHFFTGLCCWQSERPVVVVCRGHV